MIAGSNKFVPMSFRLQKKFQALRGTCFVDTIKGSRPKELKSRCSSVYLKK